jgi:hypothetical protein
MKKTRFSDNQIMDALERVESGISVHDFCRELGISTATFNKYLDELDAEHMPPQGVCDATNRLHVTSFNLGRYPRA